MAPQGLFFWPGLADFHQANFTLSHGTDPSVCTFTVPPQRRLPSRQGTLRIVYGSRRFEFPDCVIDEIDFDLGTRQTWEIRILDRRWRWRETGRISGQYNTRIAPGEDGIQENTKKKPRDLMKLCLDAMGERDVDLGKVPNTELIEVNWDYELPSDALEALCEQLGCRIIIGTGNRTLITPANEGRPLPSFLVMDAQSSVDPPELPPSIIYATPQIIQIDAQLEAVGLDLDGKIKPIQKLEYMPDGGWEHSDRVKHNKVKIDGNAAKTKRAQQLARESVWRWYRVKLPLTVPTAGRIDEKDRDRLYLLDRQVETTTDAEGNTEPRDPWVWGLYYDKNENRTMTGVRPDPRLAEDKQRYKRGYHIDAERQLVIFPEPVYGLEDIRKKTGVVGFAFRPAKLWLRVAVMVRDKKTRGIIRFEHERRLTRGRRGRAKPAYLIRDDHPRTIYRTFNAGGGFRVRDNKVGVRAIADDSINEWLAEQTFDDAGSALYAGLHMIPLDGAIQQITWSVTGQGKATTRVSRNREELLFDASRREKLLIRQLQAAKDREERNAEIRARRHGAGRKGVSA